jgi:enoyl-CoA hydratase
MGDYQTFLYEKEEKLARITLNNPEKLNPISVLMRQELTAAMKEVENDDDVLAVIIRGAGKSFSGGHDLGEVYRRYGAGEGKKPDERKPSQRIRLRGDNELLYSFLESILYCWKVTIAQVHGKCVGGASHLAFATDITIAAEDAQFSFAQERLAFAGSNPLLIPLMNAVGWKRLRELVLTGRTFSGLEAAQMGFATRAVPADQLQDTAERTAQAICLLGRDAVAMGKANTHLVFDRMGFHDSLKQGMIMHTLGTNVRWEPDEFNFVRERRERGTKEAFHELHDRFTRLGFK